MSKPKPEYIAQLVDIHASAFSPGWSADDFTTHLDLTSDDVLDIVQDGEVCGLVIIRTAVDQSEILTIVVAPTHKRKGLGSSLLQMAEDRALERGADIMFLEVAADNPTAMAMYKAVGYHQCGTRPRYYRREIDGIVGRVDAILFQKHLT